MLDRSFADAALNGKKLSEYQILYALRLDNHDDISELFRMADTVRRNSVGDEVHLRALLEISNICGRNCNYCGVRRDNKSVKRYKLTCDEILEAAAETAELGFKTVVLQSGESKVYSADEIANIVSTIKSRFDMAVTLSLGEYPPEVYKMWRDAGADRYLLRQETADADLYSFLHPDSILSDRMKALKDIRAAGLQTGAGCMVGSPTQTAEQLAKDILFYQDFQPDMVGIGPFIPHKDTPFRDYSGGTIEMTLKAVALTRLVTVNSLMPATTALASISKNGYFMGLNAGCDVIMINYTPDCYRRLYDIYPGKKCMSEDMNLILEETKSLIEANGRTVSNSKGDSRKGEF